MNKSNLNDIEVVEKLSDSIKNIKSEISKVIIGQDQIVNDLLVSLLARGHCLLVGVPGLAKTLLIKTLAEVLDLKFNRIQFTPDLMPSDITGTEIIDEDSVTKKRSFRFIHGPVFANILLADEINRTPPKTQAALLEAMQELQPPEQLICLMNHFLSSRLKIRLNRKEHILCRKHSWIDLCSIFG